MGEILGVAVFVVSWVEEKPFPIAMFFSLLLFVYLWGCLKERMGIKSKKTIIKL